MRRNGATHHRRPIGIDLFAGVGGLSLGFEQAGFDVAAAVEIDPIHACAHHFNFPATTVIPRSVVGLSAREIRALAGIGREPVDVVFGGAPCQGFSLMGHRQLDDPRNMLVREFVRLVADLDADYFVFENVKGLTTGKHRRFIGELVDEFDRLGYSTRTPWLVLNASSYGVPQDRERLFLLGAKKGLALPAYPMPTTSKPGGKKSLQPPGPSCGQALSDLPDAEEFDELLESDSVKPLRWGAPSSYAAEMRCADPADWHFGYRRKWPRDQLTASLRTDHTEISRRRFSDTPEGEVEPISRFYKLHRNGVSNTLRAGTDSARGAFTSPRPIHYEYPRCVTVREMARLHGFPDWFRFHVTKWHGARQIGNSVPPPLGRAVAVAVLEAIGAKPDRPREVVELADEFLLRFDMSQAANHWDVPVPIAKRNLKSGAKKRKQAEIEAAR